MWGKRILAIVSMIFNNLLELSHKQIHKDGSQRYTFSMFAMLNYAAPMFIVHMANTLTLELIVLRIAAIILCFGLCFVEFFSIKLREKYYPIYWYVTLWLCLPFLSSYTSFITRWEECWIVNMALALILLLMLVSWIVFITLTSSGILAAYLMHMITKTNDPVHIPSNDIYLFAYLCAFILLSVLLFMRQKEVIQVEKIEVLKLFGGAIAHEVNSPLAATRMLANTLVDIAESMIANSTSSEEHGEIEYNVKFDQIDYEMITQSLPKSLLKTSQEASKVVEILLLSLRDKIPMQHTSHSIASVVNDALQDYGLSVEQKENITHKCKNDFKFTGSKQLMKHVIYNLMRNAFKHSGENVKITINIQNYKVYFTDFGRGIPPHEIKKIFKSFYTKSQTGTGIGLAFCNTIMKSVGGAIECKSAEGKYTTFILSFPTPHEEDYPY